ncbi:MAG: hypothetical protein CM1200mP15_13200 [Dehalococcoidia bacterium]|nr:MAG: hypothetical protein CM1200mP15_13200 [Dehalococcoidia bacterium]
MILGLPGDTKLTLTAMIAEVKPQIGAKVERGQTNVAKEIADMRDAWLGEWQDLLNSDEVPINPLQDYCRVGALFG